MQPSNIQISIGTANESAPSPAELSPMSQSGVVILNNQSHNYETQSAMQGLLITDEKGELVLTECESSHDYLIKPEVPYFLKFVISPAVILMQLVVFVYIYKSLASTSCTDYSTWDKNVMVGVPVATVYVSAEITHQVFTAFKMCMAAVFSRSPWPFFWSLILAGQFIFEILVYSRVMAASGSLQDLIQNFVSLAVTNEADDKVGTMLGIKVGKILFMDEMEGEECCDLAGKRVPGSPARPTKNYDDRPMSPLQKKLKLIRESSRFGPNNVNWLLYSNAAWVLRASIFGAILAAMLAYIFTLLTIPCPITVLSFKAPYSGNVGPAIPGSTLKELLATQHKKYSDLYKYYQKHNTTITDYSFEEVHLADDDQTDLDFAKYNFRFPFFSSPDNQYTYVGAAVTSNGLVSLNQGVGKTSTAFPTITNSFDAAIAPFFADMDAVDWTKSTEHIYKFGSTDVFIVVFENVPLNSPCVLYQLGNGKCDDVNNVKACNFDNGDCCKETCKIKTRRTTYDDDYEFGEEDADGEFEYDYGTMEYTQDEDDRALATSTTATGTGGAGGGASSTATSTSTSSSWSSSWGSSSSWGASSSSWSFPSMSSSSFTFSSAYFSNLLAGLYGSFSSFSSSSSPASTGGGGVQPAQCTVFNCKDDNLTRTDPLFKGSVSFEVMMTSCGLLQISYPGPFTTPPADAYTIGFQWEALANQPTDSSCRGQQCNLYYQISNGTQITLNSTSPTSKDCGTGQYTLMPNMYFNDTYVKAFKTSPVSLGLNRTGIICRVSDYGRLGDGRCDDQRAAGNYNSAACGFDGGDCCPKTCVSKIYYCGNTKSWGSCIDPCQATPGDLCATSTASSS